MIGCAHCLSSWLCRRLYCGLHPLIIKFIPKLCRPLFWIYPTSYLFNTSYRDRLTLCNPSPDLHRLASKEHTERNMSTNQVAPIDLYRQINKPDLPGSYRQGTTSTKLMERPTEKEDMGTEENRVSRPSSRDQSSRRIACDICRGRKVRCDRVHPVCGRCRKLGHKCGYTAHRKPDTVKPNISQALITLHERLGKAHPHRIDTSNQRKMETLRGWRSTGERKERQESCTCIMNYFLTILQLRPKPSWP
jgi:hypothetical protein